MKQCYFAYGSNLFEPRLQARCASTEFVCRGLLDGYRFCYPLFSQNLGGGVTGLEVAADSTVEGVVYALAPEELLDLDRIEGTHLEIYRRRQVTIHGEAGGTLQAWTYLSNNTGSYPPTQEYRDFILQGASNHRLSQEYLVFLRQVSGCR